MPSLAPALLALAIHGAPANLIDNVRTALHVDAPAWSSTLVSGNATYYSEPSTFTYQFDPSGKFLQIIKGPLGESYGSDGAQTWEADRSGATRQLDFEDKDIQQATLLLQSDGWLNPPSDVKVEQGDGNTIKITLASGLEETVDIDPSTHLPTTATFVISPGPVTVKLGDWRPAGEWKIPLDIDITAGGLTDSFDGQTVSEGQAANYSMPAWKPTDISFNSSVSSNLETKRAPSGHLMVHPLVNGKDVGWFIVDSGADIFVIDPSVADSLNMPKVGMLPLVGVGGVLKEPFRIMSEFKLGPATLKNIACSEFELAPYSKFFGVKVVGIFGYDLFRRSIISVDLNTPQVSIYDPATFKLPSGDWTPAKFSTGNIAIRATMEGDRTAWYRLDTGANGTVQFHAPYVQKEHLLDGRKTESGQEAGAGGVSQSQEGTIGWFELAGHRFENPMVSFSQATVGAFDDRYLAGNIGQDFMKPFTVYFDFGNSQVALLPKQS